MIILAEQVVIVLVGWVMGAMNKNQFMDEELKKSPSIMTSACPGQLAFSQCSVAMIYRY